MSTSNLKHRLAAILAADAVGYSRLMAGDDRATVLLLDEARAAFREQIDLHQGRVVDMAGDSVLAVFDTATGAVVAALAVQQKLEAAGATRPQEQRLRFRIGVHLGDVIEKTDGTVYGDGVNIAARLQALAEPGGIRLSDMVCGAVRDRVLAEFEDAGEHQVKNLPRPVRSYRVAAAGGSPPRVAEPPAPERPSLAVLPFNNMSGDAEQDYFADGITEDIITDVSRISGLFVIARNSSFAFKNRSVDIKDVGRQLGVRHVLEGSVRRVGMKVRINVQLIDAASGGHVWAERFDRDLEDIFALQDEVTRRIVDALKVTLQPAERASLADSRTRNVEAHDCFLRGRELMTNAINKNREFFDSVVAAFRRAIELDPGYAEPYAGLGMAYCLDFQNHWADTPDALNVAAQFAAQAIDKGPNEPYAHYVAAVVATWKRDLVGAKSALAVALTLNPNYALAYGACGLIETYLGRPLAAVPLIERAILLDPVFTQQYLHFLGTARLVAGHFESAAAALRERIRLAPKTDLSRSFLAAALGHLGDVDEARRVWSELKGVNPKYSLAEHLARLPFQHAADLDTIRAGLAKAGLPD